MIVCDGDGAIPAPVCMISLIIPEPDLTVLIVLRLYILFMLYFPSNQSQTGWVALCNTMPKVSTMSLSIMRFSWEHFLALKQDLKLGSVYLIYCLIKRGALETLMVITTYPGSQ